MTEPSPPAKEIAGHKQRKMTPGQWNEAVLMWKMGETTLRALSEKYGISEGRLSEKFGQLKAKKGELLTRQHAAAEQALAIEPSELARRIYETKNDSYRLLAMLRKAIAAEFVTARQAGRAIGTIGNEIKTIRDAAQAVRICREEAYAVLGIREDQNTDELPELLIRGLTPNEIDELQDIAVADAEELMDRAEREAETQRALTDAD